MCVYLPGKILATFKGAESNTVGSGIIGLQEMVLQTHNGKIHILPGWPKHWDVQFKLHAPDKTLVEVSYKDGKIERTDVTLKSSEKEVIIY